MSHVGVVPTGENPSAGSTRRKPPAVRIDESAVVLGVPITFRAQYFLANLTRIERRSPVEADSRVRTDGLDLGEVALCQLSPIRKTTTPAVDARVASPAKHHA